LINFAVKKFLEEYPPISHPKNLYTNGKNKNLYNPLSLSDIDVFLLSMKQHESIMILFQAKLRTAKFFF